MVRDTLSMYYDEDITINLEVLIGELNLLAEPLIIIRNFVLDYLSLIEKIDIQLIFYSFVSHCFIFYLSSIKKFEGNMYIDNI